jgi:hypothetical protein
MARFTARIPPVITIPRPLAVCSSVIALPTLTMSGLLLGLGLLAASAVPAQAGPVVCNTTIEAPTLVRQADGSLPLGPVEVTRCGVVKTTSELVENRFFSYTAPFAQGVSIGGQISDMLGLAVPGRDGGKIVAFGFPDQTIVWDGTAVQNTYRVLLEEQSSPIAWRTADVNNGFCSGLPQGSCGATLTTLPAPQPFPSYKPVRGLW